MYFKEIFRHGSISLYTSKVYYVEVCLNNPPISYTWECFNDAKVKELSDEWESATLWGHLLVGGRLPGLDLPVQLVDEETHLGHKGPVVVRANSRVSVVALDVVRLQPLVEHTLGIFHCPITVDAGVDVHVLSLLVKVKVLRPTQIRYHFWVTSHGVSDLEMLRMKLLRINR